MPDLTAAQLQRLTNARWQGEQALFTTAVAMLTERPAMPDDLAGLVARLRDGSYNNFPGTPSDEVGADISCADANAAADAILDLAAENARLSAGEPQCAVVKPLGWHNGGSVILRTEAEVRAEAWAAAIEAAASECDALYDGDETEDYEAGWCSAACVAARNIRAMLTDDASTELDRIKAEAKAEGMCEALDVIAALPTPCDELISHGHEDAYRSVEAAIPEVRK